MTPAEFQTYAGPTADAVAHGTGLDRVTLLAQWAVETACGAAINNQNNLGNIRCLQGVPCVGGFSQFPTLGDFALAAIATFHNGYYPGVLATAGKSVETQIAALGASPWDAGHYGNPPGSALIPFSKEFSDMTDAQYTSIEAGIGNLRSTQAAQGVILAALAASQGTGTAPDLAALVQAVKDNTAQVSAQTAVLNGVSGKLDAITAQLKKDLAP